MTRIESPALLLQAAAEVAEYAAGIAMKWYRTDVNVEIKGDGSPVTIADREAERAARTGLAKRFPRDGVFGEELADGALAKHLDGRSRIYGRIERQVSVHPLL